MRIFVAGGTGILGRPLVQTLVKAGHTVSASTHRSAGLAVLQELGAQPVTMDGRDETAVRRAILEAGPEVVINQMTALSGPSDDYGSWLAVTNQLRNEGTRAVMEAAREAGCRRVVSQSASFMTRPGNGHSDESSPPYLDAPGPVGVHIRASVAGEEHVLGTPSVEGVVLRYGFLYGEGTAIGPGGELVAAVRAGKLPIVGAGDGVYPFVHVQDAVSVTVRALDAGGPGVYNVVADEPAPQAEWVHYLADLLHAPQPPFVTVAEAQERLGVQSVYYGTQLRRASNAKARAELGMTLEYPSWRAAFRQLFN